MLLLVPIFAVNSKSGVKSISLLRAPVFVPEDNFDVILRRQIEAAVESRHDTAMSVAARLQ